MDGVTRESSGLQRWSTVSGGGGATGQAAPKNLGGTFGAACTVLRERSSAVMLATPSEPWVWTGAEHVKHGGVGVGEKHAWGWSGAILLVYNSNVTGPAATGKMVTYHWVSAAERPSREGTK